MKKNNLLYVNNISCRTKPNDQRKIRVYIQCDVCALSTYVQHLIPETIGTNKKNHNIQELLSHHLIINVLSTYLSETNFMCI